MERFKSILDVLATVMVIVAASVLVWNQMARPATSSRPSVEDASGTIPSDAVTTARGDGKLALVEFSDFQCPFCGRHARDTEPRIREAFVSTGIVRQVFINLPLPIHPLAEHAGEAALCAQEQGKFWEMHDTLFRDQARLSAEDLTAHARALKLDTGLFTKCLSDSASRRTIDKQKQLATALTVQATPAFFLGTIQSDGSISLKKRINGALPFEQFRAAIVPLVPKELQGKVRDVALNADNIKN